MVAAQLHVSLFLSQIASLSVLSHCVWLLVVNEWEMCVGACVHLIFGGGGGGALPCGAGGGCQ